MNRHALSVLQFDKVLAVVADYASSALGAARVRALEPTVDLGDLEPEHTRVSAMRSLVTSDDGWAQQPIPDVERPLTRLRVEGTTLDGRELRDVATLLRSSRLTSEALGSPKRSPMALSVLSSLRERLVTERKSEEGIERAIDDDGSVRDDASPALRRVRRELRSAQGELVALLERVMSRLESHLQVPDGSVTVRNGRYVIPVRREGRGSVGGIVHDTSGTGATLFMEPPAAIEACNRIRELESDEVREVDRILLALSDAVRPLQPLLRETLEALIVLDSIYARARYAVAARCAHARMRPAGNGFRIKDGRHPLLLAQGIDVVPFDLAMEPGEQTLLISGPNTGGKTVLLKALGLLSLMVQSGIPAPVAQDSDIAVYDDIFADIGDEQSIEASLSTFSAHLKNLGEILRSASSRALVLVDELGSGTDPLEGAALGGAILEDLTTRGAMTVATTHLGALKELATEVPGVINASLQFDAVALAPTYYLIKGIPGRSYGISIARRLALPEGVLQRAEERIPLVERDVNALLASLEIRDKALTDRERETVASQSEVQERAHRLSEREKVVRERERSVERESRKDARKYLLEARSTVEKTIREIKRAGEESLEEVAREARQRVEQLAAKQGERLEQIDREESRQRKQAPRVRDHAPVAAGDYVEVLPLEGRVARVLEVRADDEVIVAFGVMKMAYPRASLRLAGADQRPAATAVAYLGDAPEVQAATEIDLRGLRVYDIDETLMQAVDAAIRADLRSVRIIHGKGTGALRDRVSEMLRKDTRVKSFRVGLWNEGGTGVTLVEL
ncbi:MAG: endonuclease MutS2 [Gemmatimonadaceae bacterium]|nr:endonuclease MutS2 [Gemmatimonadaceae bacterium]